MRSVLGLLFLMLVICPEVQGAQRKVKTRRRPVAPAPKMTVQPSDEIEARVLLELGKAQDVLAGLNADNVFASPYLVSAVYYHDGLLDDARDLPDTDPDWRITGRIAKVVTGEVKARFVAILHEIAGGDGPAGKVIQPVRFTPPKRRRATHQYAIDLFAPEGSAVRSASGGIVVLAESGWTPDDPLSTSSRRGGNSVIVFDPDTNRFFRYAHLDKVNVAAGDLVDPGAELGTVGHTGFNANRQGHGGHLHFEVNEFTGQRVRALSAKELRELLLG